MKMDASSSDQCLSSLNCEVNIIRAKNIDLIHKNKYSSPANLFVRCYLSAGNNKRVQLNTKEIPSSSSTATTSLDHHHHHHHHHHFLWNECFSLECLGNESSINSLRQQGNVVFELRWRRSNTSTTNGSFLGRVMNGGFASSKLLGRAEIPWKDVFESTNMEIETWLQMVSSKKHEVKPPKLQVRMKVGETKKKIIEKRRRWEEEEELSSCGCKDGCGCKCVDYIDYDLFELGFALHTFED